MQLIGWRGAARRVSCGRRRAWIWAKALARSGTPESRKRAPARPDLVAAFSREQLPGPSAPGGRNRQCRHAARKESQHRPVVAMHHERQRRRLAGDDRSQPGRAVSSSWLPWRQSRSLAGAAAAAPKRLERQSRRPQRRSDPPGCVSCGSEFLGATRRTSAYADVGLNNREERFCVSSLATASSRGGGATAPRFRSGSDRPRRRPLTGACSETRCSKRPVARTTACRAESERVTWVCARRSLYHRASNGTVTVQLSKVTVSLPTT